MVDTLVKSGNMDRPILAPVIILEGAIFFGAHTGTVQNSVTMKCKKKLLLDR